jgi:tetratricopeptide (TPR) repeat protein
LPLLKTRALTALLSAGVVAGALLSPAAFAQAQMPHGTAGAMLAARDAGMRGDFPGALPFLQRLHAADPGNLPVLESLVITLVSLGDIEASVPFAAELLEQVPGNHAASVALLSDAFARRDYAAAQALIEGEVRTHPLIDGLGLAWAHMGQGRVGDALEVFEQFPAEAGVSAFAQYCTALALALVGDVERAVALIEGEDGVGTAALNRRGMIAYAQLLGQLERYDDALAALDDAFGPMQSTRVEQMRTAFREGRALAFDVITDPADGLAEVAAVLASALRGGQGAGDALLYARMAAAINPGLGEAWLTLAQLFEERQLYALAYDAYGEIPAGAFLHVAALIGQAQTLDSRGDLPGAIERLQALVSDNPESIVSYQILGDYLRRAENHADAITAYTRAMDLAEGAGLTPEWRLYFARAVAFERSGDWPRAEADFRAALEQEPDQPTVLNYLGYSLVERRENLEEALEMIERAVAGEPTSGYIVDSLAWALFRLGRYEEAVPHMERAVELMPEDAILNDHLGDVYWAVGRQREAYFQWRRALSFGPHDDLDMDRVRRKIEMGLDRVLIEEDAPPLHPGG